MQLFAWLLPPVATSRDMERLKKAFEDLNKEGGGSSTWSHGGGADSWGQTKSQLSQIAGKLSAVSERSHQQVGGAGRHAGEDRLHGPVCEVYSVP